MPEFEDETHFFPLKNGDPHYEAIGRVASAWSFFEFHISQLIWWLSTVDDERGACLTSNMHAITSRVNCLLALLELETRIHPEPLAHDKRPIPGTLPDLLKRLRNLNNETISPLGRERNRIVHDTWMYGKNTGVIAQIRATADRKLDYGFRPASITDINTAHKKILRLDQAFLLITAEIRARLRLLRQAEHQESPNESDPENPA